MHYEHNDYHPYGARFYDRTSWTTIDPHEIGHSLGAEHDTEGLMMEDLQDDHKTYITTNNINEIITFHLNINK